ncbi:ATP synthase complex assembly protein atp12 [Irineochytrium annulatum]|nr:ATP synthase complex assembly protein atp12 [Irineochytrium annulatum]
MRAVIACGRGTVGCGRATGAWRHASTSTTPTAAMRFWKKAEPVMEADGWRIHLDGRRLKSPGGTEVLIPKEHKRMALLVAAEWEGQEKLLKAASLPATSLVVRGTESLKDGTVRSGVIDLLLRYLNTDSICYHQTEPEALVALQNQYWNPILDWASSRFSIKLDTTDGIASIRQPEASVQRLREHLESISTLQLAALERAVLTSRSLLIGLALMDGAVTAEFAADAARVEVYHQTRKWGEVEDAHDIDLEVMRQNLGIAAVARR